MRWKLMQLQELAEYAIEEAFVLGVRIACLNPIVKYYMDRPVTY